MLAYSGPFARVRAGNKRGNTSMVSNNGNTSVMSSASAGKSKATRPKPVWDADISDLDRYKLTKEEMLRKKNLFVSKHNIFASPSASKKSKAVPAAKRVSRRKPSAADESGVVKDPLLELTSLDYLKDDASSDDSESASDEYDSDASSDQEEDAVDETPMKTQVKRAMTPAMASPTSVKDTNATFDLYKPTTAAPARSNVTVCKKMQDHVNTSVRSTGSTSSRRRNGFSNLQSKSGNSSHANNAPISAMKAAVPKDILELLMGLQQELRSYEQISGKRSVFDESELDELLETYTAEGEESGGVSLEGVVRYLLQLVCQSMTYLLQSELKINQQKTDYDTLSKRVDILTTLIASGGAGASSHTNKSFISSAEGHRAESRSAPQPDLESLLSRYDIPGSVDEIFSRPSAPSKKTTAGPSTPIASPMNVTSIPTYEGAELSRKMGTSTSDWLFASPITHAASPSTPATVASIYAGNAAPSSSAMKHPAEAQTSNRRGVDETFLSQKEKQTARVAGRQVSDFLENSLDETFMYPHLVHNATEDDSDRKYHENLISVARRLHMEDGHSTDDSANYDMSRLSAALEMPPPPPPMMMNTSNTNDASNQGSSAAPSSRVEKLQKVLQASARLTSVPSLYSMDYPLPSNHVTPSANSAPASIPTAMPFKPSGEQVSVGGPMSHVPIPQAAPQHPFKQPRSVNALRSAGKGATPTFNLVEGSKGRLTFDATSGSY